MKHKSTSITLGVLFAAVVVCLAPAAHAANCSTATVSGSWEQLSRER